MSVGGATACDPGSALRQYDENDKSGQTIVSYSIVRRKVTLKKKIQWNQAFLRRDLTKHGFSTTLKQNHMVSLFQNKVT
jgi:hypothetical protein